MGTKGKLLTLVTILSASASATAMATSPLEVGSKNNTKAGVIAQNGKNDIVIRSTSTRIQTAQANKRKN